MAGNYLKYGTEESAFGKKTGCDLPVDSHELIALAAPRLTFISYGIPEKGDAKWLDQKEVIWQQLRQVQYLNY